MPRAPKELPDCKACGACCVAPEDQESYCDVTVEDVVRLSKRLGKRVVERNTVGPTSFERLAAAIDPTHELAPMVLRTAWRRVRSGPMRGFQMNSCVMLRGSVMHQVACSVYKDRPEVCKSAVQPGNRMCLAIRKEMLRFAEERDEDARSA